MARIKIDVLPVEEALDSKQLKGVFGGSGLPTGKRQHKPFTITRPTDKSIGSASDLSGNAPGGGGTQGIIAILIG